MARRIDPDGFMETVLPADEEAFSESARAAFDLEFDAERGRPGLAVALILILVGFLLGSFWYALAKLVTMFGSQA